MRQKRRRHRRRIIILQLLHKKAIIISFIRNYEEQSDFFKYIFLNIIHKTGWFDLLRHRRPRAQGRHRGQQGRRRRQTRNHRPYQRDRASRPNRFGPIPNRVLPRPADHHQNLKGTNRNHQRSRCVYRRTSRHAFPSHPFGEVEHQAFLIWYGTRQHLRRRKHLDPSLSLYHPRGRRQALQPGSLQPHRTFPRTRIRQ